MGPFAPRGNADKAAVALRRFTRIEGCRRALFADALYTLMSCEIYSRVFRDEAAGERRLGVGIESSSGERLLRVPRRLYLA